MTPMPLSAALQKHFPDGGVTLSTMQNAIRQGKLNCSRLGRVYMVTAEDIQEWHRMDMAHGPQSAIIRWHGKPIAKEKRAWAEVVKGAGLGDDVTPHVMKHSAITWLLQSGMELWDISGLTGTSLKTIEKTYGHQDADYQRAAAKAFVRKIA